MPKNIEQNVKPCFPLGSAEFATLTGKIANITTWEENKFYFFFPNPLV